MLRARGLRPVPSLVGCGDAAGVIRQGAESIDQGAMAARIDQRAIVVLPMDLDQSLPHLAQKLNADANVVDEGAAPAVGSLHAPQDETVLRLEPICGEELERGMAWRQIEARGYLTLRRPAPHQRSIATAADGERKRVEEDGFAGPGFSGQHR